MNRDIYNYLGFYFEHISNSSEKQIKNTNKYFKNIEKLEHKKIISEDYKNLLIEDMCNFANYVLSVISDCPSLEIRINKTLKNSTSSKTLRSFQNISAIGFVDDEDDEENEDFECLEYCDEDIDNT